MELKYKDKDDKRRKNGEKIYFPKSSSVFTTEDEVPQIMKMIYVNTTTKPEKLKDSMQIIGLLEFHLVFILVFTLSAPRLIHSIRRNIRTAAKILYHILYIS